MSGVIRFNGQTVQKPANMSIEEAQEWAAEVLTGIEDAEGHEEGDDFVFVKRAGSKG